VADGLDAMHRQGLVHRDLHPGNVVVDDLGRATLIDLGSARPDDGRTTATVTGVIGFLPPDLVNGVGTAATDRWGLGMLTVFALLGHPQGSTPTEKLAEELTEALADIPDTRGAVDLLLAMVDPDPAGRPPHGASWAASLQRCLEERTRPKVPWLAVAGALALAGVLVTGFLWLSGDPAGDSARDDSAGSAANTCAQTAGDAPSMTPGDARQELLADEVERVGGLCPNGLPVPHFQALTQPVVEPDGSYAGVVVLAPGATEAVHMPPVAWFSYMQRAGTVRPNTQQPLGGYPTGIRRVEDPDATIVDLDSGGLLVGRRDDTQLFWIPARAMPLWQDQQGGLEGALGFPTTDPYWDYPEEPGIHMEFEGGAVFIPPESIGALLAGEPVNARFELQDGRALLRNEELLRERIVRQRNQTSWWVDADGTRHWIPDRETFQCLGGRDVVARRDMPGPAVAQLPLGAPVQCP
jgi:hypothetical protein